VVWQNSHDTPSDKSDDAFFSSNGFSGTLFVMVANGAWQEMQKEVKLPCDFSATLRTTAWYNGSWKALE
jgi:hypothetical protein